MEAPLLSNTLKFKVPSGFEVVIREQNGDDDDIISRLKNNNDGTSINKFIASICLSVEGLPGKPSHNDILKWKNRDKYYVLLKSRIFSLGDTLTYKYKCINPNCGKEETFEEDLKLYDRDFSKPVEETNNGFKYQIQPYLTGEPVVELDLTSGKKVRYKYLNGLSEKKLLEINKDEISKNTELLVRDMEYFNSSNNQWTKLQRFDVFSSRDMMEIRSHISKHDIPFDAVSECKCPYCETVANISLLAQPSFFFPQEI